MAENDDDPPDNVVPFPIGHAVTAAIAGLLAEYYRDLVREPLPERHLALLRRFDDLSRENSAPREEAQLPAEKTKSAE
jgi:hypothetical protein